LNQTRIRILSEMRHNPNITKKELCSLIGISDTVIYNNIKFLKDKNIIEKIGSNKNGYWKVNH
jgi:ATP-dependent DNA helicase RecG